MGRRGREALALLFGGLLGLAACGPHDAPTQLPPPPSQSVQRYLGSEPVQSLLLSPGVAYHLFRAGDSGHWAVHLVQADLTRCEVGVAVVGGDGRARVSELVAAEGPQVLAGVNGDFFTPDGRPVGPEVIQGVLRRSGGRPGFAWRPGEGPWIGAGEMEGDSVFRLGWSLPVGGGDGATQMVGGFPELLEEGRRVGDLELGQRPDFSGERHPRTAVGYDGAGTLWLVVVDGRQAGWSQGMTLGELVGLFEALGATEALNLDGGGSSVMVLGSRTVSRPSDPEGERPVPNALLVKRDPAYCGSPSPP